MELPAEVAAGPAEYVHPDRPGPDRGGADRSQRRREGRGHQNSEQAPGGRLGSVAGRGEPVDDTPLQGQVRLGQRY